jgi:putative Mn2+ efflux pump MntP
MSLRYRLFIYSVFLIAIGVGFMFIPNSYFEEQRKILKKITPKWWFDMYEKNHMKEQVSNFKSKIVGGVILILLGLLQMFLVYYLYFR